MKPFVFVLGGFVLGVAAAVAVPVIGQGVFFQDPGPVGGTDFPGR